MSPFKFPWYRPTNRKPMAIAMAWTVPMMADSCRYKLVPAWGSADPMTSAASPQNPK